MRRGYSGNEHDDEKNAPDHSKETNSQTKYAPMKKYYEKLVSHDGHEKQTLISHNFKSDKEETSDLNKPRNDMQSNFEKSSYVQNKMLDSQRSAKHDMSKFYTFSKEINFDSCKKEKLERKYHNLRDIKKNNC